MVISFRNISLAVGFLHTKSFSSITLTERLKKQIMNDNSNHGFDYDYVHNYILVRIIVPINIRAVASV